MTAPAEIALALMEDDTVLCADCVQEVQGEGLPETPATIVHAWLADLAGEGCCWCRATDDSEARSGCDRPRLRLVWPARGR